MSKEMLKTIFLAILVFSSIFLTLNIWTYSPDFDPIDDKTYIKDVAIPDSKQLSSIIKPIQMIYYDGNQHYGTTSEKMIGEMIDEMANWDFKSFQEISSNISNEEIQSIISENGMSEFVFSDSVPFSIYNEVIHLSAEDDLPENDFDRILVKAAEEGLEYSPVYFIESDTKRVYRCSIESYNIQKFKEKMLAMANDLVAYSVINTSSASYLYVPTNSTTVNYYKYYIEPLEVQKFKDTLFQDPSAVTQEYTAFEEEYTDLQSIMRIDNEKMMLYYVNPTRDLNYETTSADLLERSLQYMNEHDGWDENYRYVDLNKDEKKTTFRLFVNGLPVFNKSGISEVKQVWNKDAIYRYDRPMFSLNLTLPDLQSATLPSGREVYRQLKKVDGFEPDLLEYLQIGYKMTRDVEEQRLIILEPTWYYKYNNQWEQFSVEDSGGIQDGLE